MSEALTTTQNQDLVVLQKTSAMAKLFTLKPATLELVAKSSRAEGTIPGKIRVVQTNEHFNEMKLVIIVEPNENRKLYRKGEYSRDALECFSTDNVWPHPSAKDPKSMYCEVCSFGEKMWLKYREAKQKGVTGDALSALIPACKKSWNLFVVDRNTKAPYWLNIHGTSVKPFENAMQSVARLFSLIVQNIKAENVQIAQHNASDPENQKPLVPMPQSVGDVIYKISFTIYPHQPVKGGQFVLGFKDFAMLRSEDQAEFGVILQDFVARRAAGRVASQEETEGETVEGTLVEPQAESNEVTKQNSKIQI